MLTNQPIISVWAENTPNKVIPTQAEIQQGVVYRSEIESDIVNGRDNIVWNALQYAQQTGGLYNALIPYPTGTITSLCVSVGGQISIAQYTRIGSTGVAGILPLDNASITTRNGIDIYSNGTLNPNWAVVTSLKASTATQASNADLLDGQPGSYYAPINSPTFTGTVTAPTPATSTNNTQIATTAFVKNYLQTSITGSCTTNGTTGNTLVLTGIVSALALEIGDVIQITGSTGGLNDKLFTVESITDDNSIIVNYEHAGNRGDGSLKLANQTATVTITRIAKWYNAPIGLGQAWVNVTAFRPDNNTTHTNTTKRAFQIDVPSKRGAIIVGTQFLSQGVGTPTEDYDMSTHNIIVPVDASYRQSQAFRDRSHFKELR